MKVFKVRKYLNGSPVYPGLSTLSLKLQTPNLLPTTPQLSSLLFPTPLLKSPNLLLMPGALGKLLIKETSTLTYSDKNKGTSQIPATTFGNQLAGAGINVASNYLSGIASDKVFGDSELGRSMGTLFSSGVSSAGNTITNNLIKGEALTQGLALNAGASLAGAGAGIAANYIGKGLTSAIGNNYAGRAIGAGVSTGLGTIGGTAAGALATGTKIGTALSSINPYALAGNVIGSALSAGNGPSKEYGGKYGKITQGMDLAYDVAMVGANAIPVAGQIISGAMALNKGLSNLFGSTDGMTKTDAILGSAFMPAPVKWLNMWGSSTTGTFNNQSWLNSLKANSFMGNAFGNLNDKFDKAREEAGKTYGTFSQGAYKEARDNINFSNYAWDRVLAMADLNELLNIRSLYMTSINNLRYASNIQGNNRNLVGRGKQGMKIFNNATNHNIGMRLLSAAALIDNKQMILSAQSGTKVMRPRMKPHRKGEQPVYTEEELKQQAEWNAHLEEVRKQQAEEQVRKQKQREEAADKFNKQTSTVMGAITQQANETPFTGLEYQQAAENLRQEKVEKFHEAEKIGEATMMADLAVSAAPLLLRGFRWAFNKAGLLVKVPILKTALGISAKALNKEYIESPKDITSDVGELIAEGSERSVYASKSNPNIVYKIEDGNAALEDINNIKIRSELTDDVIAPESTIGYFKHKNGKYYRVTQLDKYKSFNPDNYDSDLSPELNLEIINTLEKAGWKVEVTNGAARTASKNGKVLRNLEHYNWGRDSLGNLKLIDQDVINLNGWQGNRYVLDLTTLEGILNFINNDIIPRMLTQGHNVSSYTPTFRQFSPKTDAFDEAMSKANSGSGAWFTPASNDITIRGPLEKQDFGLAIHEAGGHGLRYNMLSNYVPTKREYLNEYIMTGGKDMSDEATNALLKMHTGDQIFNTIEALKLRESYPWIKTYFERNPAKKSGDVVLRESGSVNTQFRSHYSNNGKIVGKELDKVVDKASPGVVLRDLIEQPYTSSIVEDIAKITGKDPDALLFYGPEMLEKLVNQHPELLKIVSKVKDTMKTVGSYGVPITVGGTTAATLHNKSK